MDKKKFYKRVLVLAGPIALQNLLTALLNIFDQMMVGWLPGELPGTGLSVADTGLSAVLLANQIVFIYQIVIFAVCNTVNIFIAQYTENGNEKLIKNRAGFTFVVIAAVALIFTFVCYFGAEGVIGLFNPGEAYRQQAVDFLRLVSVSFVPMGLSVGIVFMLRALKRLGAALVVNVCACGLNFLLNYTFMFGLFGFQPIGLLGAAYGTIVSRAVECVAMIAVLFLLKNPLVGHPKEMFRFDAKFAGQYVKMFFPILCNEIFWVLATTVYLFVYDKLEGSEVVLASVNIAQSLDKIVSVVMIGVGSAAASGLSVPLSNMLRGWRFGLGIWIIPILLGMLVWGAYFLRHPDGVFQNDPAASGRSLLRSGKAWQVTVFYLSRVGAAYFFYTWIPIFLRQRGMSYEDAGFILSVAMFAQLPATLSAHVLEKAMGGRGLLIVMAMALAALSCWGILYFPLDWAVWMAILFGLATGTVFSRGMALMVERARTPSESIRLSGMSQGIGFTMGALLSLLFTSFLHQGGSFLPFCLVYTLFCVLGMVSGRMSARPGYV